MTQGTKPLWRFDGNWLYVGNELALYYTNADDGLHGNREHKELIVRACNAYDELVDYISFSYMFPAINSSQQIKLESAATERGWKHDKPVEHFLNDYRHRVLAKARGEAKPGSMQAELDAQFKRDGFIDTKGD